MSVFPQTDQRHQVKDSKIFTTPNRIKKTTRHMIAKLLKKKGKKNLTSSQRKETQYLQVSKSNREAGF